MGNYERVVLKFKLQGREVGVVGRDKVKAGFAATCFSFEQKPGSFP